MMKYLVRMEYDSKLINGRGESRKKPGKRALLNDDDQIIAVQSSKLIEC